MSLRNLQTFIFVWKINIPNNDWLFCEAVHEGADKMMESSQKKEGGGRLSGKAKSCTCKFVIVSLCLLFIAKKRYLEGV